MLVWNSFSANLIKIAKDRTHRGYNTDLTVIPRGLTSILQPLDVSINKPFKDHFCEEWRKWVANGEAAVTKAGNLKRPSLEKVAELMMAAWNKIDIKIIKKSFKKCEISNALNRAAFVCCGKKPESQEL